MKIHLINTGSPSFEKHLDVVFVQGEIVFSSVIWANDTWTTSCSARGAMHESDLVDLGELIEQVRWITNVVSAWWRRRSDNDLKNTPIWIKEFSFCEFFCENGKADRNAPVDKFEEAWTRHLKVLADLSGQSIYPKEAALVAYTVGLSGSR